MQSGSIEAYAAFPALNATLNGASAVLIATGRSFIRKGKMQAHRACMIAAVVTSSLFLVSYLWYHAHVGVVRFPGTGWVRPVYFGILISHTVLAAVVAPLVIVTLYQGLSEAFGRHRRIARWTYPVWMYVSVTGVVIYVMLYQVYRVAGR